MQVLHQKLTLGLVPGQSPLVRAQGLAGAATVKAAAVHTKDWFYSQSKKAEHQSVRRNANQ
jgi:hypothetical protein